MRGEARLRGKRRQQDGEMLLLALLRMHLAAQLPLQPQNEGHRGKMLMRQGHGPGATGWHWARGGGGGPQGAAVALATSPLLGAMGPGPQVTAAAQCHRAPRVRQGGPVPLRGLPVPANGN